MRLIVDGDGSPVKEEISQLGEKYQVPVLIVTSYDHFSKTEASDLLSYLYVDQGPDMVDFKIVSISRVDDWVFTQDYGLASLLVGKCRVFHHSGKEYTSANIERLLGQRHLHQNLRRQKIRHGKVKAFKKEDREAFYNTLDQELSKYFSEK